ncbi:hypothetical protein QVD99_005811 [Batrachochytrium dendrobatidis]|nr:hypothetical protein O5D80_000709 [Batrachochytrium dendrobatidis]KAK5667701.1 hypothetical protein QVD99_005811 [Batrachochytrium dendrobatidis]
MQLSFVTALVISATLVSAAKVEQTTTDSGYGLPYQGSALAPSISSHNAPVETPAPTATTFVSHGTETPVPVGSETPSATEDCEEEVPEEDCEEEEPEEDCEEEEPEEDCEEEVPEEDCEEETPAPTIVPTPAPLGETPAPTIASTPASLGETPEPTIASTPAPLGETSAPAAGTHHATFANYGSTDAPILSSANKATHAIGIIGALVLSALML